MQLLAAKELLLNPPVSSDFFPHTSELESAGPKCKLDACVV